MINKHNDLLQLVPSSVRKYMRKMPPELLVAASFENVPDYFSGGPEKGNEHVYPLRITKGWDDELFSSDSPYRLYLW